MGDVTRRIGLSLGADICWPRCYEEILSRLKLRIPWQGDTLRFAVERVTIEPFDLTQPVRYDVVIGTWSRSLLGSGLSGWQHDSNDSVDD